MSRRFGRNQKRALKAEAARWQKAFELECEVRRHTSEERRRLRSELDYAKQSVVRHSGLFAPETVTDRAFGCGTQLRIVEGRSFDNVPDLAHDLADGGAMVMRTVSLPVLLSELRTGPDAFGHHLLVNYEDRKWGYAFTHKAVLVQPRERFVQHVAETLARQIHHDLSLVR